MSEAAKALLERLKKEGLVYFDTTSFGGVELANAALELVEAGLAKRTLDRFIVARRLVVTGEVVLA